MSIGINLLILLILRNIVNIFVSHFTKNLFRLANFYTNNQFAEFRKMMLGCLSVKTWIFDNRWSIGGRGNTQIRKIRSCYLSHIFWRGNICTQSATHHSHPKIKYKWSYSSFENIITSFSKCDSITFWNQVFVYTYHTCSFKIFFWNIRKRMFSKFHFLSLPPQVKIFFKM